ncbi:MAG: hypothetical protein ACREMA_02820 [Longimicrobiales bacterium]
MTFLIRAMRVAGAIMTIGAPLAAQTIGAPRPGVYGFGIEVMRAQIRSGLDISGVAVVLVGHAELRPGLRLLLDLPFGYAKSRESGKSSSTIGNPYLGLQLRNGALQFDAGGRLPLASPSLAGAAVGAADFDRSEAYLPDLTTLSGVVRLATDQTRNFGVAGFAGIEYSIISDAEIENELLVVYGFEAVRSTETLRLGARLNGLLTPEIDASFNDNSLHQLGFFADFGRGRARPGVQLRLPLDQDSRDGILWIGGVGLHVVLGRTTR